MQTLTSTTPVLYPGIWVLLSTKTVKQLGKFC